MVLIYLVLSVLYAIAGGTCFVTFLILNSYSTAVWGLLAGIVGGVGAHISSLAYRNRLRDWYEDNDLHKFFNFGYCAFAIGTSGLVYHLVYGILTACYGRPVDVYTFLPVVWTFITLKAAIMLMYFVRNLQKQLTETQA